MPRMCTNPKQSNQLLNHGFSERAADMWWTPYVWTMPDPNAAPVLVQTDVPELYTMRVSPDDMPAFSLTTLLQALPGTITLIGGETYDLRIIKDKEVYTIEYSKINPNSGNIADYTVLAYRDGNDLIDIAVQMIIFLLKSNIPLDSEYIYNNTI